MDLVNDMLNTIPVWVVLQGLKLKFCNGETIRRITSILGTPLNGNFIRKTTGLKAHVAVGIDDHFAIPDKVNIIIEKRKQKVIEEVKIE